MEEIIYNCQEKVQLVTAIQNQLEANKPYVHQLIEVGLLLENCKISNFRNVVDVDLLVNDTNETLNSLEMIATQVNVNQQQFDMTDRSIRGEFKCLSFIGK